jgi:GMP synthase (glutamine-hydrolysing)
METPSLLVIGHETDTDTVPVLAGTLTTWAADRGVTVVPVVAGQSMPDPADLDAVAVLGSAQGAWDDDVPWLDSEIDYLRSTIAAGTPVLGICFGGQLLARVLGGRAEPASGRRENGWQEITTTAPDEVPAGPWMEFHFDTFTAPPSSEVLATSPRCDQAFRQGPHLGLQFHPEVTPAEFDLWMARLSAERLIELGIDPSALRAETVARAEESRVASWGLFDRFAERAGLVNRTVAG